MDAILEFLRPVLEAMAGKYGWLAAILMYIGILRLIMKPLMVFLQSVVVATPSMKDNELLEKLMANPLYSVVVFVIDWLGSIKLPKKA